MMYGVIGMAIVMIVLIVVQARERRDLYDRIMARDLMEYRDDTPKSPKSAYDRARARWRNNNKDDDKESK